MAYKDLNLALGGEWNLAFDKDDYIWNFEDLFV